MSKRSASPLVCSGAILAALQNVAADKPPPEWVTIFPALGDVACIDTRRYTIDGATLVAEFSRNGLDLPLDVNHSSAIAAPRGERSDAVGWIKELKVEGGALLGRADWTAEGADLIRTGKYRYLSPDFTHTEDGRATRLRAVALVVQPALTNQPALASAQTDTEENSMKTVATALGLSDGASEAALLAAVTDLKGKVEASVPKAVHDATCAQLADASKKLGEIEKATRDAKVATLIEDALKAKKILPAEREHYVSLCATDEGLGAVEKLFAARSTQLGGSGLDTRKQPEGDGQSAAQLAAAAGKLVAESRARNVELSIADAMTQVQMAGQA